MKRRFSEAMNSIREDYIQEAMEAEKRRSTSMRWVALAASLVLILSLGFGTYYHTRPQEPKIVLPPCRIGSVEYEASISDIYDFKTTFEIVDAVAVIRIGNWLSEDTQNGVTYYEAEVIDRYKGNLKETIIIMQDGSSAGTVKGYPLFTHGDEMMLFLKRSVSGKYAEDCYWIFGSYARVLHIAEDKDGEKYVLDVLGFLEEEAEEGTVTDISDFIREDVISNFYEADPVRKDGNDASKRFIMMLMEIEKLLS